MRTFLFLLLVVAILPLVVLVAAVHVGWYYREFAEREATNLEVARAVATAFTAFIRNITREEQAIGHALADLRPQTPEQASKYLAANAAYYKTLLRFCWTNPSGEVIASSDGRALGVKVDDAPWFKQILGGADRVITDLRQDGDGGPITFIIACGIRAEGGALEGVVFGVIDSSLLGVAAPDIGLAPGGVFSLFDRTGTVVYTYPERALSFDERRWLDKDPTIATSLAGREVTGTFIFPPTGERRIGARVPLPEIGWAAGASRPLTDVTSPLLRTLVIDLGITGAVIAASGLIAGLITRRITGPARRLRDEALAIGAGDLDRRVDVRGVAELTELGEAFNRMAVGLKDRTAQLETSNRQLQQESAERKRVAEDLARSNQDLEQFAYVASHDLQEPLRIVSGYLQLLDRRYKGRLDAEADEFINFAVDGAARMQVLIQDLLAYSRVGTQGRQFAPVACESALKRALANLATSIADTGAAVTHDPLPTVLADGTQIVQLFQNLVGNAIKFRSAEPPRIHIGACSQDGEPVFSVRDNGIGIDPKYADRIFALFQRLHTREKYPGTGIGLSICKRIVERHGGRLWVESQPGKGSTFYFTVGQPRSAKQ